MNSSKAQQLANIFEIMADYQSLLVLVYLVKNHDYVPLDKIADIAETSLPKARNLCERLENKYILIQKNVGKQVLYKMTDGKQADYIRSVLKNFT